MIARGLPAIDEQLSTAYNNAMKTNLNQLKQYEFPRINNSKSVSSLVYSLQEPFDRQGKSAIRARTLGISQKEVLADWDAKAAKGKAIGTALHNYIGRVLRGQTQDPLEALSTKLPCMVQFDEFWTKAGRVYEPIWIEIPVTSDHYKVNGRVDALLYHKADGTYHVVDWKSGKWTEEGWNKFKPPFDDLFDSTPNLGAIQTGIYKVAIEQSLDIPLEASYLVHFSDQANSARAMADLGSRLISWLKKGATKHSGR